MTFPFLTTYDPPDMIEGTLDTVGRAGDWGWRTIQTDTVTLSAHSRREQCRTHRVPLSNMDRLLIVQR